MAPCFSAQKVISLTTQNPKIKTKIRKSKYALTLAHHNITKSVGNSN